MRITIGSGNKAHKFDAGSTVGERYATGRDMIKYLGLKPATNNQRRASAAR